MVGPVHYENSLRLSSEYSGVPGVGKTSTAECVAAQTRRPLFPITCGDIGTTPSEVEQRLEQYFNLAHKWGCVLLLDEADVYLATREKGGDLQRNSLVSGMLSGACLPVVGPLSLTIQSISPCPGILLWYSHTDNEPCRRIRRSLQKPHPHQSLLP